MSSTMKEAQSVYYCGNSLTLETPENISSFHRGSFVLDSLYITYIYLRKWILKKGVLSFIHYGWQILANYIENKMPYNCYNIIFILKYNNHLVIILGQCWESCTWKDVISEPLLQTQRSWNLLRGIIIYRFQSPAQWNVHSHMTFNVQLKYLNIFTSIHFYVSPRINRNSISSNSVPKSEKSL